MFSTAPISHSRIRYPSSSDFSPMMRPEETYGKFDPSQFSSNFGPIKRAVCTECHVQASAGENCLLCHNYHVNEVSTRVMATTLPGRTP